MRGVGKNWWNSTGFVAGVIDVGLIVLGLGLANSSVNTVNSILLAVFYLKNSNFLLLSLIAPHLLEF